MPLAVIAHTHKSSQPPFLCDIIILSIHKEQSVSSLQDFSLILVNDSCVFIRGDIDFGHVSDFKHQ